MYVWGVSLMVKLLFLEVSSSPCYSNSLPIFLCSFSDPYLMEGLSHYIEFSKPFPSYTCSSFNPALKFVSYRASSLALCERYWLKILFRGLLHINAARKATAMYLMRWWQLFPKIFLYPYHLRTRLKSIFIVETAWKITQVTQMPAWLIFVRSEEDDPFGQWPSTHSWRDHLFWALPSRLLLLGRIPISKWGLRPNIRVQAFAPTYIYIYIYIYIWTIFALDSDVANTFKYFF